MLVASSFTKNNCILFYVNLFLNYFCLTILIFWWQFLKFNSNTNYTFVQSPAYFVTELRPQITQGFDNYCSPVLFPVTVSISRARTRNLTRSTLLLIKSFIIQVHFLNRSENSSHSNIISKFLYHFQSSIL